MLRKMTISPAQMVLFLMCLFVVRPYYIQITPFANEIWAYLTIIFTLASCVLVFMAKRHKHILVVLLFAMVYIIATFLNQSENTLSAVSTVCQMVLGFNIGILAFCGNQTEKKVNIIYYVSSIYVYLYLICGFLDVSVRFFAQSNTITFFGYDNYAAFIILPLMAIIWGLDVYKNGTVLKRDWLCLLLCLLYNLKLRSYTIILVLCLFVVVYLIVKYLKEFRRLIKPWVAVIVIALLLIGILEFQIHYLAAGILEAAGKGLTLNSRTWIWDFTITAIGERPILGQGYLGTGSFQELIGVDPVYHSAASHGHNILLDVLICTGVVGLICFLVMLYQQVRCASKYLKRKEIYLLLSGLFLWLLLGMFDGYPFIATFYLLVALLGAIPRHYQKENEERV